MFKTEQEKQAEIEKRVNQTVGADVAAFNTARQEFRAWYDGKGKDDKGQPNLTADDVTEFNRRNDELGVKESELAQKRNMAIARAKNDVELEAHQERQRLPIPGDDPDKGENPNPSAAYGEAREAQNRAAALDKALRDVANSPEFRNLQKNKDAAVTAENVSLRALFTTGAGGITPNNLTNILVLSAQRRPMVADLIPQTDTQNTLIRYVKETVFTNGADGVLEGGVKPEAALQYDEVDSPVRKIAVTLPVTEEQLADVPQLEALLRNRLTLMLMLKEEDYLLNGNGVAPQLQGFLTASGVQTFTQGSTGFAGENIMDVIFRMNTGIEFVAFANVTGTIVNPLDYQSMRLTKTSFGEYLFGSPAEAGPRQVWGNPLVVTPAIVAKTILTGDFAMYSHISRKLGLDFAIGWVNDQFRKNQVTLRLEERLSLEIYRGQAFAKGILS